MRVEEWERIIRVQQPLMVEGVGIEEQSEVADFYEGQLRRYGPCGRAMAYPEENLYCAKLAQYHDVLSSLIRPSDTVLDVGCGFGSLLDIIGDCQYEGVDLVAGFVQEARRRHPRHRFVQTDVMKLSHKYDWVIGLGITGSVPEPAKLVYQMWKLAGKGLVTDFIDLLRYREDLNNFDLSQCLAMFHEWDAHRVVVHSWRDYIWAIFEVHRPDGCRP